MDNLEFSRKVTDYYHRSLVNISRAIQQCGGDISLLDKDMTLQDLLMVCSSNSVILSGNHDPDINEPISEEKRKIRDIVAKSHWQLDR